MHSPLSAGGKVELPTKFSKRGGLVERHLFLFQFAVNVKSLHIVCTRSLSVWGVELPTKFSKRGGLVGPQLLERVAGKEGMTFFMGDDAVFTHKKLKCEIFNNKKSLQAKIFFSVITNNSNWGISPKDLVTFKR